MGEVSDTDLGTYVYCASHVGPHLAGWCTVPASAKLGLLAETAEEAEAEVKHYGWPWYGHCDVCYRWIANEVERGTLACPGEHSQEELRAAKLRHDALRMHLWDRAIKQLEDETAKS